MDKVRFMRVLGIRHIHQEARSRYQIDDDELVIPESAFRNPMTLVPMVEVNRWFEKLEGVTGNPDVILDINRDVDVGQIGVISHWLLSGSDLASTIRRVNYGFSSLQSGAFLSASLSGSLIKWAYRNPMIEPECKVHDSVRMAMALTKILRTYLGQDFSPLRVQLSGSRKNTPKYEAYFGCEVEWSHSSTEIWFHSELRLATKQQARLQKGLSLIHI